MAKVAPPTKRPPLYSGVVFVCYDRGMNKRQRTKKKRTKSYSGTDAAPTRPVVHRYTAEVKSPAREWWEAKRGPFKIAAIAAAILGFLGWLVAEALRIIF